jgi:aldose 1-epimerase
MPAQTVLKVTPDRLIPDGLADVIDLEGGRFDFRTERSLSGAEIDHAFTDMSRDAGRPRHSPGR